MNRRDLAERAIAGDTHAGVELARLELARGRPGRPPALTPQQIERGNAMLDGGATLGAVARALGVSTNTVLRRCRRRGAR